MSAQFTKDGAIAMLSAMPDHEPVFVLRAQDRAAAYAIKAWVEEARALGASDEKLAGAEEHRQAFLRWEDAHRTKVPD